jgi:ABC-type bacteriocin/lantibiotic exporter with double-glycine peptidase domain
MTLGIFSKYLFGAKLLHMAYRKIAYYFVFVVWGVWFMQSSSWASELENRNSYCGVHVTKFMLRYYNVQADFVELVRDLNCRDSGIVSLDDIVRVLRQRGLRVSARNYESISELSKCLPCVVRMDQRDSTIGHFVVVVGCNSPVVSVWDGLQGVTVVPVS